MWLLPLPRFIGHAFFNLSKRGGLFPVLVISNSGINSGFLYEVAVSALPTMFKSQSATSCEAE